MYRLCYISSVRAPLAPSEIDQILTVSRRNNKADGVTGLLVVGERRFLQFLEGPESAVRTTFARIQRDPRHYACVRISDGSVTDRQFEEWDMGIASGDDPVGRRTIQAVVAEIRDPNLRAQFDGFIDLQGGNRAAA